MPLNSYSPCMYLYSVVRVIFWDCCSVTFLTTTLTLSRYYHSHLPLSFSKPSFSHGALHTGSASEWFTPLEALYKYLNTIQYNHNNRRLGVNFFHNILSLI